MLWTADKTLDVALCGAASVVVGLLASLLGLLGFWTTLFAAWTASAGTCLYLASLEVKPCKKAVLVTGCDSGFGHAIALHLDKLGFRVFAGCLLADAGGEGAEALRQKGSERLRVLQLDVTSEEQIDEALRQVKDALPRDVVFWGLVNNAGIAGVSGVEWVPLETYKKVAEVNLFGLIAMTKAFLPLIRRFKGRIVNISSVLGSRGVKWYSPYITSKYGVEGFSDCLRLEMQQFGVKVCIVQPSNHTSGTQLLTGEMLDKQAALCWEYMDDEAKSAYGEQNVRNTFDSLKGLGNPNLQPVVDAVTEAVTQRHPRARYCSAAWTRRQRVLVARHLPEWIYDSLYN